MHRLLVVLALLAAARAHADTKVLRFSQSTPLPATWRQLPERISTSLAAAIDAQPSDESLISLHCDGGEACLDRIADKLGATELVFGTIRSGGDRDTKLVVITRYVPGRERSEAEFVITLTDDAAPRALARQAQAFLDKPLPREPDPIVEDEQIDVDRARHDELEDEPRDETTTRSVPNSRISGTTYALLIGGGAGVAIGIGFSLQAWSLRNQVALSRDHTVQDLQHIVTLEQRGQAYTNAGIAFSIAGAAVLGFGIYRMWYERRNRDAALAVAPTHSGAMVGLAGTW